MSTQAEVSAPSPAVAPQGDVAQQAAAANAAPATAQASVGGDSLTCQWSNCGERCGTAEQLYDHVCERHVGRKSTNNLNLTCQWGNCRTTTVKRDHITSHIRVHVPLKPHKCDFCGKAFKRPQDLKKHVKTHADDSVLLRSPEPNRAAHGAQPYGQGKPGGYYPDGGLGPNAAYHAGHAGNPAAAFYGAAPHNSAYGPVYYAVNQPNSLTNDYEIRKKAAYDALNEFFGDAKRRSIDPTTYYDVGQRLAGLANVPLPVHGYGEYQGAGTMVASAGHHQPAGHHYSLPLPALRTKTDLMGVDSFLDQLQSTVYENPNHLAAAGVAAGGYHTGLNYRGSNSPPTHAHAHPQSSHAQASGLNAPATETPALTPASSVMSYASGHSPSSVHSQHTISPTTRPNMGSMYPTLPSVSQMSEMSSAYPTSSGAPSSGLGGAYTGDSRRRYSGGILQSARRNSDAMDTSSDPGSPKDSRRSSISADRDGLHRDVTKLQIQSPGIALDPSLRSPSAQSSSSEQATDHQQESWLENMRTIEKLRNYIRERLEAGAFESDDDATPSGSPKAQPPTDAEALYPVLKAVHEDN